MKLCKRTEMTAIAMILKPIAIFLVKTLQWKYKQLTLKSWNNRTNQNIANLQFLQSCIYFFKCHFRAWGFFHPNCVWGEKSEKEFRNLFPQKEYAELENVIWHNPESINYYHNKIYDSLNGEDVPYSKEIETQLRKWKVWN